MAPSSFFGPASASSQSIPRTGTPPVSRSGSAGSYGKRSSVVPFTRPGHRGSSEGEGTELANSLGNTALRPRRTSSGASLSRSFEEYPYSHSPARRSGDDRASSRGRGHTAPTIREEGFRVNGDQRRRSESGSSVAGDESPRGPSGLLSRHFSGSVVAGSPVPSRDALEESLQKCLDRPSALRRAGNEAVSATDQLLTDLQGRFEVFTLPSVTHVLSIAAQVLQREHSPGNGQPSLADNLQTAAILAELGASAACISASLLHGVLESRAMTEGQLRETLQHDVVGLVVSSARLSDLCQVRRQASTQLDQGSFHKFSHMLLAMADVQAVILVLADRLQMLRSGDFTSEAAREVLDVFAPLADQLGVWSLKAELEDLAFQGVNPKAYAELRTHLQENVQSHTIKRSLEVLKEAVSSKGITNVDLVGRPKNLYSVWKKMQAKGYGLEQLYDLRALRIVVRSKADCYWALREVEQLWQVVPGRDKDYIRQPKANGYQSLHTVVVADDGIPMEVQIRTDKMHFIAEYGVAAHWRYKEDADVRDVAREQQVAWARMLISWQLELADKKLRPDGAPAHDTTLSHICPFPKHDPTCPAADTDAFLARHAPRPQAQDGNANAPVYVIVLDHATRKGRQTVAIKELPANSTASQLHELLQLQRAAAHSNYAATRLLVNGRDAEENQLLSHGDKVEVLSCMPPIGLSPQSHAQLPPSLTHALLPQRGEPPILPPPMGMTLESYSPARLTKQTTALRN